MAFVEIENFKDGLDTRRPAMVGAPGTLVECVNAHITRGGDIESRKEFVEFFSLPANTFGLHSNSNRLYVFGSATAPTNLPGQIVYQQLVHPSAANMTALLWAENMAGLIYAIAEYDDGSVYHFYDGARVTDWDAEAALLDDSDTVALYMGDKVDAQDEFVVTVSGLDIYITAAVAGTAFTIAQSVTGTGTITLATVQANSAAVAEVRATASFEVTGGFAEASNTISVIKADTTDLISEAVPYVLDDTATAQACVVKINQGTGTHGYTATSAAAVVTITAPEGTGATVNGDVLTVTPTGFVTVGSVSNFASGVTAVAAVPQIEKATIGGTYAGTNTYTLTLNSVDYLITGLASGYSRIARAFGEKMYTAVRGLSIFSAVGDPTSVTTGTGIGSIDVSSQDQASQRITAYGIYQNLMAIFTADSTQVWQLDPDPDLNTFRQLLQHTGTEAPKSVTGYGNSDLLYLSKTGIRSLRARDSANNAAVDDIGTRIDKSVIEYLDTLTQSEIEAACSVIDPLDGRAWMAVDGRIFIFSYFPGSKVSAWSWYEPGFSVENMAVASDRIYLRSSDTIYVYGGTDGMTYPEDGDCTVTVRLPFIDANRLSGGKGIKGIDLLMEGQWTVSLLVDPRDESRETTPMVYSGMTTLEGEIVLAAQTTHFAPKLTSTKAGPLTLSSVVVHFEDVENN